MNDIVSGIIMFLIGVNTLGAIITVFREPRDIAATWAWLLVLFLLPGVGFIMYFFLGRKLSKQKIFDMKTQESFGISKIVEHQRKTLDESKNDQIFLYNDYLKDLARLFLESDESIITRENNVELILDGRKKFDRLIADIKTAEKSIHMIYYIFKDDEIGREIMDLLVAKAQAGVEVLVIYDAMGSRSASYRFWERLIKAGGQAIPFFGKKIGFVNFRINYRNHRKIAVIDGKIGYLGGYNIGEEYVGKGPLGYWRDTHMRITGNAVLMLQSRFFMDWNAAAKPNQLIAYDEKYFPISYEDGTTTMQIVSSGPDNDYEQIKMGMIRMITMAKKTIFLQTPYFVPDESMIEVLRIAALSGVDVRVMIPCKPDHLFVYRATEFYAQNLAEAGVKIYTYQKGFLHSKTLVVDGEAATIGTANFDVRSFKLNFEINAFIYDKNVAREMEEIFLEDMTNCQEATLEYFAKQSKMLQFRQMFSRLLGPIL